MNEKNESRRPDPIAVGNIHFPRPVDVPQLGMRDGLSSCTKGRTRFDIQYEPWIRHHRITVTTLVHENGKEKDGRKKTILVHETGCVWTPAA